ncbi:MAG TPA: arylsulfatase [Bryobacteraceae bacterium]|nr:arylsulfatase [Bryobacteraceae bacterium]
MSMSGSWTRRQWLASMAAAPAIAQTSRKPNVVLIVGDDLGYGDIGCYGQSEIRTPNIDRLAGDGLRFTQAYSGSTVCAPSRCALMTGKHTGHATVRGNLDPHVPLTPDETTIAQIFQRAGYRTGAFGKWGLGTMPDLHALPTRKGFDTFYGYLHQVHAHTYYPDMLWDNERETFIPQNFGGGRKKYSHDLIAERALKFIDDNKDGPFFLYAPFTLPHGKFEAPDDEPYSAKPWPAAARNLAAMITRLDASVGQIMERLQRHRVDRDTLVIFTSDNGPVKLGADNFRSNGPLRGIKRDLYEGGIRVPFITRWAGRIKPGTSHEVLAAWDLLPTFAELTDQPAPKSLDGVPALKALLGTGPAPAPDRPLYWEFHEGGFKQAVRWRNWKAVREGEKGPVELYDLAADISEKNNVAAGEVKVVAQMTRILDTARTPSDLWKPKARRAQGLG